MLIALVLDRDERVRQRINGIIVLLRHVFPQASAQRGGFGIIDVVAPSEDEELIRAWFEVAQYECNEPFITARQRPRNETSP